MNLEERKKLQETTAISIFLKILNIYDKTYLYDEYEKNLKTAKNKKIPSIEKLKTKLTNHYYTPDLIISDNFIKSNLEDLMFIDINEPEGSLLKETGIELDKKINEEYNKLKSTSISKSSILLNTNTLLSKEILGKVNKINNRYALNRDTKNSISINNGIVFCMSETRIVSSSHINLSELQMYILISEVLYQFSDGKCNFYDIKDLYRNQFVSFEFSKKYKNLSFIVFIGRESMENISYFIINDNFLKESNNIVAKILKNKRIGNGNIFRKNKENKSGIIIDLQIEKITEESIIYPCGNMNYVGKL